MIRTTKAAPSEDAKPEAPPEPEYVPTVSVKTSLESRDHIGLLQGRPCKSLKRHLAIRAYIRGVPLPVQAAGRLSDGSPGYSEQRRQAAKRLGLGFAVGEWRRLPDLERHETDALTLDARKALRVMNDGEVVLIAPPLHYRLRASALRVLVPAEDPR